MKQVLINPNMNSNNNPAYPDWHRRLVLVAKNTFVWLDQLSKKYNLEISKLHQIPEDEFDLLRTYGINGLWLIGIWKRSPASRKIKELYGRHHLIASAYSILEYEVTDELGGEESLHLLKERTLKNGFYLACDMVPNHTGIDSSWIINHPEWYIYSLEKPNAEWTYTSPDLSPEPGVNIWLEDGYFNQSRAAETFQYKSTQTGENYFIFHGNDGTSMPWNDTAQLNYLMEDVRNAVKKKIFEVAKEFDIIRLDAAMTLVRKHYKRLWFPDKGGDRNIPYRGSFTMTKEEFDEKMPREFWGEVLAELPVYAPDTLMIAEAFWLMEKYFVKELGMHRVYNSAFMNQLRDEENTKFHAYLKEILQSNPLLLEKFVNYLTTPDEESAIKQFGKSKKYFGICGLMAALPGLPMFGHGQIEGFTERYRMDLKRSNLEEKPDNDFIKEHFKQIAPLLNNRERFSRAENLKLLSFWSVDGIVDENVFVLTNICAGKRSLIIYNNQNKKMKGIIARSINRPLNSEKDGKEFLSLFESLGINSNTSSLKLKELRSGLRMEVLRKNMENGIRVELKPYDFLVFDVYF